MASTKLSRTAGTASNTYKATISAWVKRATTGTEHRIFTGWGGTNAQSVFTIVDDRLVYQEYSGSFVCNYQTNRLLRDTSAFYHLMVAIDTTLSTATDRVKIYINGLEQRTNGGFSTDTQIAQNTQLFLSNYSSGQSHNVGARDSENYFDGSMTHFHFVDGTAYDASAFGETDATTGIWKPKTAPSVTYGTNGFFLKFENSGSMGTDSSPNANNFTVNGTLTQTVDTPSNVFATFNSIYKSANQPTYSNGNLTATSSGAVYRVSFSTLNNSTGKWYAEFKRAVGTSDEVFLGVSAESDVNSSFNINDRYMGETSKSVGISSGNGSYYISGSATTYASSYTAGDIIGIALDLTNKKLYLSKNGQWSDGSGSWDSTTFNPSVGAIDISSLIASGEYAYLGCSNTGTSTLNANFGNGYFGTTAVSSATSDESGLGIFEYTVPSGYYALCTKNINTQEYA